MVFRSTTSFPLARGTWCICPSTVPYRPISRPGAFWTDDKIGITLGGLLSVPPLPPPGDPLTRSHGNFDQAAAQAAIVALEDTVALLQGQGPTRDGLASTALEQWNGPDADSFRAQRYPGIKAQCASTIRLLNSLITTISDASVKAANDSGGGPGHRGMN